MRTNETNEFERWEVQHRYPTNDLEYHRLRWANTDLAEFGHEAISLVQAAAAADEYSRSDYAFSSSEAATSFLARFVLVAVTHQTIEFRVARVRARVEVEEVVRMAPPPICGKYGYYGSHGGSRAKEYLYCQQPPGHAGKHGQREAVA